MLVLEFRLLRYWSTSISRLTACLPVVCVRLNPRISDVAVAWAGWADFEVAGRPGISVAQALAWSQLKARAELSSSRVEPGITHGPKYLQLRLPSQLQLLIIRLYLTYIFCYSNFGS